MTEFYADMHGGEEVAPGAIAAAETALEGVAVYETPEELVEEIERLRGELAEANRAAEFNWSSYQNAVTWHLAMAREIVRRGGTIPKGAPDLTAYYLGETQWLHHRTDADAAGEHPVIPVRPGTTLADLMRAVLAHTCNT
ncbi:hypothetical protein ACFQBR_04370 [Nocardiopsis tropica]|uniref:hypothetical protein n=1 Tax=Nocardiopsis tropica TaxID=109330 RepID=UPI0031D22AE3